MLLPFSNSNSLRKYAYIFLSIIANGIAYSQEPAYWHITDENGLPSQNVYRILQDQKGYIWMGTENGLCRFDGKLFKTYSSDALLDNEIINLQQDKWGNVWFGNLSGQIGSIQQDSLLFPSFPYIPKENKYHSFEVDGEYLWLLDDARDPASSSLPLGALHLHCFKLNSQGSITKYRSHSLEELIRSAEYLVEHKGKRYFWYAKQDSLQLLEISGKGIRTIRSWPDIYTMAGINTIPFKDSSSLIYRGKNLWRKESNQTEKHPLLNLNNTIIRTLVSLENDEWILSTNNGLIKGKIALNEFEIKQHHFRGLSLNYFFVDREGNYWLASTTNGVFMIPQFTPQYFNATNSKLSSNEVSSISKLWNKKFALGHNGGKISLFEKGNLIQNIQLSPQETVKKIIQVSNASLWIGFENILKAYSPSFQILNCQIPFIAVKDIVLDHKKTLWTAEAKKVRSIDSNNIYNCQKLNVKPGKTILKERSYAVFQDFAHTIWIGTTRGLYQYKSEQLNPFLENNVYQNYNVSDIKQSADSSIWVATLGDGLLQIKNDRIIRRYNEQTSFPTSTCTKIATHNNVVWVGTKQGVGQIEIGKDELIWIDKQDGLPSNEITALYADETNLWIGTPKGLVRFPQTQIQKNAKAPPVYITNVKINTLDTKLQASYKLPYDQNTLEIAFIGFAYRTRGSINYTYRMKELAERWTTTDDRSVQFLSLAPGRYTFEVIAHNEDNVPSKMAAAISFLIQPPWWKTLWFQISSIVLLMGLTGGAVYWRSRDLRKREKAEHVLRERINNLRTEALQAQMNPHFIFNSLNAIQDFLVTNDQPSAIHYLAKFANMIRQIFDQSRKKRISLEEELEFLELYLALEKLRFGEKVAIEFEVAETIKENAADILIPPLLIQPIIENAFKHGLLHKKKNGKLSIHIKSHQKYQLHCIIEDNGVGRKKAMELNEWRDKNRKSTGLTATQERLKLLHEDHSNSLIIHDLTDSTNKACGTKIELFI